MFGQKGLLCTLALCEMHRCPVQGAAPLVVGIESATQGESEHEGARGILGTLGSVRAFTIASEGTVPRKTAHTIAIILRIWWSMKLCPWRRKETAATP